MDYLNSRLQKTVADNRYTLTMEYTGTVQQMYVIRFCGEFASADSRLNDALLSAIIHSDERGLNLLGSV